MNYRVVQWLQADVSTDSDSVILQRENENVIL
jgi:hypothetical protein